MKVKFVGGETGEHGSPRLWVTETDPPRYAAQGWLTDDPGTIEIPHRLLWFTKPDTCLSGLRDTGHGTFLLSGEPLTDPEALSMMKIPAHETAVLVPIGQEVRPDGSVARW